MTTIAITTFKGGAGKTTTAVNLARGLAATGASVLGLDIDRTQGHFARFDDNIDSVDIRASTAGRIAGYAQRDAADFMVIDCAPALQKEPLTAMRAAQLVIVPVVPEAMVVDGLSAVLEVVDKMRQVGVNRSLQVMILVTMLDTRDPQALEIEAQLRKMFGALVWPETILRQKQISAANNSWSSVLDTAPRSQGAKIYRELSQHISSSFSKAEPHHG